jgi:hypothetical protein
MVKAQVAEVEVQVLAFGVAPETLQPVKVDPLEVDLVKVTLAFAAKTVEQMGLSEPPQLLILAGDSPEVILPNPVEAESKITFKPTPV